MLAKMTRNRGENMRTVMLGAATQRVLSPKEFLNLTEAERENIRSVRIIPPRVGKRSMGKIAILLRTPVYEAR
jgi:hypothetical protein